MYITCEDLFYCLYYKELVAVAIFSGLQKDAEKKKRWRDGVVDILMQKYKMVKENRSQLVRLCKEKAEIQTYA